MLACQACQRHNEKLIKTPATLHQIAVNSPWYRVDIDLIEPLTRTSSGYAYIITHYDYFRKWPEAKTIRDKSAECLCQSFSSKTYADMAVEQSYKATRGESS